MDDGKRDSKKRNVGWPKVICENGALIIICGRDRRPEDDEADRVYAEAKRNRAEELAITRTPAELADAIDPPADASPVELRKWKLALDPFKLRDAAVVLRTLSPDGYRMKITKKEKPPFILEDDES